MKCEYCETPDPTDDTYVCPQCSAKALDDPDSLLVKVLQEQLHIMQTERQEIAQALFDYTIKVASLKNVIWDFLRTPEAFDITEWQNRYKWHYDNTTTPDHLVRFIDQYRRHGNLDRYADRRISE